LLLCLARYAIVVVGATAFQIVMEYFGQHYLSVTGKVDAKISAPKPPDFQIDGLSFGEILSTFGSGLVLVPLLATMESIAVAKTFAHKFRYDIDVTQEFLALGTANVVSSFFGAYPVTGAFTRSALAAESGVRTPMGCIVTGNLQILLPLPGCSHPHSFFMDLLFSLGQGRSSWWLFYPWDPSSSLSPKPHWLP
jgi:MFS superfamily sulfate permease-like transporter